MVIGDAEAAARAAEVRRILVCSGKVYVDLVSAEQRASRPDVAICRLEQLYPVPMRDLRAALDVYPNAEEVVWVQEEPENMGAWEFIRPHLTEVSSGRTVRRVARPRSASPAEGSAARHTLNQQALVEQAFGGRQSSVAGRQARSRQLRVVSQPPGGEPRKRPPACQSNIVVPEVGESIVDARVAKWLRKEGDVVSAGDPLVELETDKIDLEVGAPQAGVLSRIERKDGEDVKVGEVLGVIDETKAAARAEVRPRRPSGRARPAARPLPRQEKTTRATPTAKKAAAQHDVDLTLVKGSGDAGRVMRRDVEQAAATTGGNGKGTPAARPPRPARRHRCVSAAPERRSHRGARAHVEAPRDDREAARRGAEHGGDAHHLQRGGHVRGDGAPRTPQADVQGAARRRPRHRVVLRQGLGRRAQGVPADQRGDPGRRDGPQALLRHRRRRGRERRAGRAGAARRRHDVVCARSRKQIRDFARRAEDGSLSLADLKGGTFTITNGGVFGSLLSTPILNPPQVGHPRSAQDPGAAGRRRTVRSSVRPMMYTALTYDHRIVDGAEAVRFLVRVKELVEDPGALLLD